MPLPAIRAPRTSGAATVLRAVLHRGPIARSTIARSTGLSPAAVTRHTAELAASGLIVELPAPVATGGIGRPHIPVDIDLANYVVGGVHIALEHTTLAVLDLRGNVLALDDLPHVDRAPIPVLSAVADRLPAFLDAHTGGRSVLGVGVATGGWVDPARGVVIEHGPLGWRDVDVRGPLTRRGGPPVHVDNHARALARAEQLFGSVPTECNIVHFFVGNVVDVAIVADGTVLRGSRAAAGDIAHQPLGDPRTRCPCGRRGCLEASVSNATLAAAAHRAGIVPTPSFIELLTLAQAGNLAAQQLFLDRAEVLGGAVALLLDLMNPELVVVTEAGTMFLPGCLDVLHAAVRERSHVYAEPARHVRIPSFPATDLLAVAAGAVALDMVYGNPVHRASVTSEKPR
jgi:predicted NBD/HSP70 family sugar kinase